MRLAGGYTATMTSLVTATQSANPLQEMPDSQLRHTLMPNAHFHNCSFNFNIDGQKHT